MHLLKQLCEPCSEPIAIIVNMPLEQGIVPDAMKVARLFPYINQNQRSYSIIIDLSHFYQRSLKC